MDTENSCYLVLNLVLGIKIEECMLFVSALGMGLCVAFIALVRLPSLKVSTLLLVGLLIYDVFWVSIPLKYKFCYLSFGIGPSKPCIPRSDCEGASHLIRVCPICHSNCINWRHLSTVVLTYLKFRAITGILWVSEHSEEQLKCVFDDI